MYWLSKVQAKNFILFENFSLDFKKLGKLLFIVGENKDVSGSDTNMVGKSVIADIITDTLFDKTIRKHSPKTLIGKFEKYSITQLIFENDEDSTSFIIKKYRSHPKHKDKLVFTKINKNGKKKNLSKKRKKATYEVIWKTLGINWETFKNRNYFGQHDNERFLEVTDSKKAKIIVDIQNLDDLKNSKDKAHKKFRDLKKKEDKLVIEKDKIVSKLGLALKNKKNIEEEIEESIQQNLKDIKDIEKEIEILIKQSEHTEKLFKGINELRSKIGGFKHEMDNIKETVANLDKCNQDIKGINEYINVKSEKRKGLIREKKLLEKEFESVDKNKIKKCTHCGAVLNDKRIKTIKKTLNEKIKDIKNKIIKFKKVIEKHKQEKYEKEEIRDIYKKKQDKFVPIMQEREALMAKLRQKELWQQEHESIQDKLEFRKKSLSKIEKSQEKYRNYKPLNSINEIIKKFISIKSKLTKEISELSKEKQNCSLSEKAFDLTMRTIFESLLEEINEFSNKYLELLADNDISVMFESQKETGSKKIVDEINALVSVKGEEPRPYRTYCGGEKGRVSLTTQLALFSSGEKSLPFLWLDEPLEGVDRDGRNRILELLQDRANQGIQTVIITHQNVPVGLGQTIKVIRENNRSRIEHV
jgi:DNA repair exonuclease SbcCD ATPase subunit